MQRKTSNLWAATAILLLATPSVNVFAGPKGGGGGRGMSARSGGSFNSRTPSMNRTFSQSKIGGMTKNFSGSNFKNSTNLKSKVMPYAGNSSIVNKSLQSKFGNGLNAKLSGPLTKVDGRFGKIANKFDGNLSGKLPGLDSVEHDTAKIAIGKEPILNPGKITDTLAGKLPFEPGNGGNPGGGKNPHHGHKHKWWWGHHHWHHWHRPWVHRHFYHRPFCGTVYVNGCWTYCQDPVVVEQISVIPVTVGEALPEIPANATFKMAIASLGAAEGAAAVDVKGVGMMVEILQWNPDSVVVRLPAVELQQKALSELAVLRADGSLAHTLKFNMLPALQPSIAAE
jgi:hypothetical protein